MTKPEAPEFQIERDYDNQCDHARSMYHMAVQAAEVELDLALGVADETRQARLAELRHQQHDPNGPLPTLEDVAMVGREPDMLFEPYAVNRLTEIRP